MKLLVISAVFALSGTVSKEVDKTLAKAAIPDNIAQALEEGEALLHLAGSTPGDVKLSLTEKLPVPAPLGLFLHEQLVESFEIEIQDIAA